VTEPAPPQPPAAPAALTAEAFVTQQTELLKPLYVASSRTWYQASVTGKDEDFAKSREAENALNRFYADPERFAQVKHHRSDPTVTDPLVKRQLEVLFLEMLGKQVEPALLEQITAIASEVEQAFNTYRGKVGGKEVTQNELMKILRTSKDSKELEEAWQAQKAVGPKVAPKLRQLVGLRNQVAKRLGFRDFYALRIAENEQDEQQLLALFDQLDRLTADAFAKHKAEVDRRLAGHLGIETTALMPWHYQNPFFQEPPAVFDTGLDAAYKQQDTLAVCRKFYAGIGLEIDDIVARSDLYEKPGKTPHAFCIDIDREGDVRMLANIVPGQEWQTTMVHELGHAVYDKYVDHSLPWLLRSASHALTTEGVAMMLDRLVANPLWAHAVGAVDEAQRDASLAEARAYQAFAPLQFSRWTQVMLRFERSMYANPDQDLNALWWTLVERYQGLRRPAGRNAPDYASKIHLVIVPVYYHNYMMGELFSAQLHETLAQVQGKPPFPAVYVNDPRVGEFLKTKIFAPGERYRWDELTRRVTGKELSAEAFARRFEAPAAGG
jgi:peptidyl-dipeptidase A